MAFLDKLGVSGKKNKKTRPFADDKQRSLDEKVLAYTKLEKARRQNMDVIEMELRNLRYNKKHNAGSSFEARYVAKIKNAYYSLGIINNAKLRLNDIETSQELYAAMNNVTDAMKIMNQIYKKSDKPNTGKYVRQSGKLERTEEKLDEKMGNMYSKVESIDDLVSNDVVERLLKGDLVEDCLREEEGIKVSIDDLTNFNLDDINFNLDDVGTDMGSNHREDILTEDEENFDASSIDFSDF